MGISTLRRHTHRAAGAPSDPIPATVTREQHRLALQEQQKAYELKLLAKDKEIAALKGEPAAEPSEEAPAPADTSEPDTRPDAPGLARGRRRG